MGCLKLEHIDHKWTPLKVVHSVLGDDKKGDVNLLVLKDHSPNAAGLSCLKAGRRA